MWENNNDDILALKSRIKSIFSSFGFLSIFSTWNDVRYCQFLLLSWKPATFVEQFWKIARFSW